MVSGRNPFIGKSIFSPNNVQETAITEIQSPDLEVIFPEESTTRESTSNWRFSSGEAQTEVKTSGNELEKVVCNVNFTSTQKDHYPRQ